MTKEFTKHIGAQLAEVKDKGLYKSERIIESTQSSHITVKGGGTVLNFCANNYLGLSDNPELVKSAQSALERYGYGMASVRFICGTQEEHVQLEEKISSFLGFESTILYSSCFDANAGLFEPLLGEEDAIISDSLNHASIIDGVRLCKAKRFRYKNNDMADLESQLRNAQDARFRLIATDGVFSMDGIIANLADICDLAEKYDAMVMVDDSHALGFVGENGRGTPEYCGVEGRINILTGTLGKALGGASGGFTSANGSVVDWLRQRSRPYLFSNTLAPVIAATSLKVLELIENGDDLRQKLNSNAKQFRHGMSKLGFNLVPGEHPIIPVMLGDAKLAKEMSSQMIERGVYVIGFSFPVVPEGKARIRTQMSAAHSSADIEKAIGCFEDVGKQFGIIS